MIRAIFPALVAAGVILLLWAATGQYRARPIARSSTRTARALAVAAVVLAVLPGLYLLLAPTYSGQSTQREYSSPAGRLSPGSTSAPSQVLLETSSKTAWQVNGPWILVPLLLPVLLTAAAAISLGGARRRRVAVIATFLMLSFVVLGALSIGWFYLPATVALALSAMQRPPGAPAERA